MLTMMYLTPWLANTIAVSAIALVYVLVIRTCWVLKSIRAKANETSPTRQRRQAPIKTLVVLGSGGHTTEMLHLIKHLDPKQYTPLIYIVATTDTTSLKRVEALGGRTPDAIYHIPRSREVGQSYMSSVATTLWSFDHAVGLVMRIRPGVLLCNGPGTCLPIAVMTFVARLLGVCEGNIIFMESFCRVTR
jgi:beta-1,4-N-acetylglucosaminyltransferase